MCKLGRIISKDDHGEGSTMFSPLGPGRAYNSLSLQCKIEGMLCYFYSSLGKAVIKLPGLLGDKFPAGSGKRQLPF